MKREQKGKIALKHIYEVITAVVLLFSIGGWLLSGKESPTNEVRTNSDFKSASLGRYSEIKEQIKNNQFTGEELEHQERHIRNLMIVSGYEGYTPFSNLYYKVQDGLSKSPEGVQLYNELRKFGSDVREKLSVFINEPTDERLREFEQYLIAQKPEIKRLIGIVDKAQDIESKDQKKVIENLEKFLIAIDRRHSRHS